MARSARVGALVIAGLLLFLAAIFLLAQTQALTASTVTVNTGFFNISGLLTGANVQYQGFRVGRVEDIQLPTRPGGKIRVRMEIDDNAKHLLRRNTKAQVQTDGLVGNQIIALVADVNPAPALANNGIIEGVEPFSISAVSERLLESVDRLDAITSTAGLIVQDVRNGEGSLGRILYDPALYNSLNRTAVSTEQLLTTLNTQASSLSGQTDQIASSAQRATESLNTAINRLYQGDGSVAQLLNDPTVYNSFKATTDSLQRLTGRITAISTNVDEMTAWGALGAFRFSELMEAGKHNFLFKRYFERRGFQEQAPFEIRERALRLSQQEMEQQQRRLYEWEQNLRRQSAATGVAPPDSTPRVVPAALPTPEPATRPRTRRRN